MPENDNELLLSVCMIVKNEAALLQRCLCSVRPVADQIVVVDTGSTDRSKEIARECGAVVIESEWRNDFAWSRNISLEHATGKWILWLDADDVVPRSSLEPIDALKRSASDRVYNFIVRNQRPGNTGTEFRQARMFPNRKELRFERRIHEQVMPSALRIGLPLETCDIVIEHHGYADPALLKKKAARNITLLLEEYPRYAPDIVMASEIADSYSLTGDDKNAALWYTKVLEIPEVGKRMPVMAGHAHYGLGNIASRNEDYIKAIAHFDAALILTPWRVDVLYSLAVAQELSGNSGQAVETLRSIPGSKQVKGQVGVDYRSAVIKSYLRCIRLLVELVRFEEAEQVVHEAVACVGFRPEVMNMAGKYFIKVGRLVDGLHSFEKSLQLRREGNIEAFIGLCIIFRTAGRDDKVEETLHAIEPEFSDNNLFRNVFNRYVRRKNKKDGAVETEGDDAEFQRSFFGML
jgi:glycosyltransferase involved in cell wall biosynthesis